MPLSVNTKGIIDRLKKVDYLSRTAKRNDNHGWYGIITGYLQRDKTIQGDLLVMNNVSTAMALNIAEKIQKTLWRKLLTELKGVEVEARYYSGIVEGNKL